MNNPKPSLGNHCALGCVFLTGTEKPVRAEFCKSYYLDASGRNHIIWPEYGFVIKHKMSHFKTSDYDLTI